MNGRAWVAGARESLWHACRVSDAGGSLVVACGHRVYGPVHRRIGEDPPLDVGRSVCDACAQALGWTPPRLSESDKGSVLPVEDPDEIAWPVEDPDVESMPTRREAALAAALNTSGVDPGSSCLPGSGEQITSPPLGRAA